MKLFGCRKKKKKASNLGYKNPFAIQGSAGRHRGASPEAALATACTLYQNASWSPSCCACHSFLCTQWSECQISSHPRGRPAQSSWLLISACPSARHCSYLGSDRHLSVTVPFKWVHLSNPYVFPCVTLPISSLWWTLQKWISIFLCKHTLAFD